MKVDNNILYADFGKALYRVSNNSYIGKEHRFGITFFDSTGNRLASPERENISYFYELDDIEDIRKSILDELEIYDNSEEINTIYVNDVPVLFRSARRLQLESLIVALKHQGKELMTIWNNDVEYQVPIFMVESILEQYEIYASNVYNTTASHKAFIDKCTNSEELQNYNYRAGYPSRLNININI